MTLRTADCGLGTGLRIATLALVAAMLPVAQPFRAAVLGAQSQSTELHVKFRSGQGVAPVYEGWERVPDGSFNMVFGYLNRNHVEQLAIPVGAQNGFSRG